MINETLARSVIEELSKCTDQNITIISKSGFVLAGTNPDHTGKFYEIAFKMIQENIPILEFHEKQNSLGIQPGIYMQFYYHRKPMGILSISGELHDIRTSALLIRRTAELILECELGKTALLYRKNAREQLLNYLLYLDVEPENSTQIHELFDSLGYQLQLPRIPLLLSVKTSMNPEYLLTKAKELLPLSSQDILALDRKGELVLFLSYPESLDGFFEHYRFYIGNFLKDFLGWCRSHTLVFIIYVGPIQQNPKHYKYGYEKTLWLKNNIHKKTSGGLYFYEHIGEYLKSQIPFIELHKIFHVFSANYSSRFIEQLIQHMDVLHENNYNFQQSSKQLFIHKNTLAFRLDKIREQLGADPIQSLKDRELIESLCYYLYLLPHYQTPESSI